MPDTGAPWNIPYVASTDLVSDWPADSLALANAIDAGLDAANVGIGTNVVQAVKTAPQVISSVAAGSAADVTGLSVTITPTSATSKVLVLFGVNGTTDQQLGTVAANLVRNSTTLPIGDAGAAGQPRVMVAQHIFDVTAPNIASLNYVYLDSPATTSATTYKVQVVNASSGGIRTIYVNRSENNALANDVLPTSYITAIEVAA